MGYKLFSIFVFLFLWFSRLYCVLYVPVLRISSLYKSSLTGIFGTIFLLFFNLRGKFTGAVFLEFFAGVQSFLVGFELLFSLFFILGLNDCWFFPPITSWAYSSLLRFLKVLVLTFQELVLVSFLLRFICLWLECTLFYTVCSTVPPWFTESFCLFSIYFYILFCKDCIFYLYVPLVWISEDKHEKLTNDVFSSSKFRWKWRLWIHIQL